jgi:hypothetical protein
MLDHVSEVNFWGGKVMTRREACLAASVGLLGFSSEPLSANALTDFFKRLAKAVGIVTGAVTLAWLRKSGKIDTALANALQSDLDRLRSGMVDSSIIYSTNGPEGLPGNRLMSGAYVPSARTALLNQTSTDPMGVFINVQNPEPPRPSAALSRAAFFNQLQPETDPSKTPLMGPSLDGLMLGSEFIQHDRSIDVDRNPDPVQRLLLPLSPHKIASFRDYRQPYKAPDFYDTTDGRVAVEYKVIADNEGVVLMAVSDKGGKIVFRRQFVLDFRRRTSSGFPMQSEAPSRVGWALLA